jgi:hypothetical protein
MSFKLHPALRQNPVSDVSRTTVMFTNAAVTLSVRHVLIEVDITVIGPAAGHVMRTSLTVLLHITIFMNSNTFLHRLQLTDCTNSLLSCLARRSTTGLAVSCISRDQQILSHQGFIAAKLLYRLTLHCVPECV